MDETPPDPKKMKLEEDVAPRLRLNASLATDPALRPATVAALTVKPENASPPNPGPPLPAGLQNGKSTLRDLSNYKEIDILAITSPKLSLSFEISF